MIKEEFLLSIPASYWAEHPDAVMADGRVAMSAGGLLVRRGEHRVLIDAGYGRPARPRTGRRSTVAPCWRPWRRWGTVRPTLMSGADPPAHRPHRLGVPPLIPVGPLGRPSPMPATWSPSGTASARARHPSAGKLSGRAGHQASGEGLRHFRRWRGGAPGIVAVVTPGQQCGTHLVRGDPRQRGGESLFSATPSTSPPQLDQSRLGVPGPTWIPSGSWPPAPHHR